VTGSLIAMSVFWPDRLPSLDRANDHAYFLLHSPEDKICPFKMAKRAARNLKERGAKVTLVTYQGGHGWQFPGWDDRIREGIQWLEVNQVIRKSTAPENLKQSRVSFGFSRDSAGEGRNIVITCGKLAGSSRGE
jgi:hypothetical protein